MKKIGLILLTLIVILSVFLLNFGYKKNQEPNIYYNVFLDGDLIATISSEDKLNSYIDKQNEEIKKKYGVDVVYSPKGLEVKKILTYNGKVDDIKSTYEKIKEKKAFTILGYQMTITDGEEKVIVFAVKEEIFEDALEKAIELFVGKEEYDQYITNSQTKIETTGEKIENVYIENEKTLKSTNISVDEKIYTRADELSSFLVFGDVVEEKNYTVKLGDTIEKIAFNNKISIEELLLSNINIKSSTSLLYFGQTLKIIQTNPKIKVVVEKYVVEDVTNKYKTIEKYDSNATIGDDKVTQYGQDGIDRVYKSVKMVNGSITYVNTESKLEVKPVINKIIVIGQKYVPTIGSLTNWDWPTDGGYTITSNYGYRTHPVTGERGDLHSGIDIALPYGSNVYAANNGVVAIVVFSTTRSCYGMLSYGIYVVINHNNGYSTLYAHLSNAYVKVGQTVERGTIIGKIGMTGCASGPHLHFGLYVGIAYKGGYPVNPWSMY